MQDKFLFRADFPDNAIQNNTASTTLYSLPRYYFSFEHLLLYNVVLFINLFIFCFSLLWAPWGGGHVYLIHCGMAISKTGPIMQVGT